MTRLTRNAYKRRVVLFGALIFISIALVSTGFAAWVMSTSSTKEVDSANVGVGVVTNSQLEFSDVELSNNQIYFEPAAGDNTGRVRLSSDGNSEQLTTTITGSVSPVTYLGELRAYLVVTQGVYDALTGDSNYITLETADGTAMSKDDLKNFLVVGTVDSSTGEISYNLSGKTGLLLYTSKGTGAYSNDNYYVEKGTDKVSFTININFNWGTTFGNMNPSLYYDNDEEGLKVSDADVQKTLEDFRALLYGYANEADYTGTDAEAKAALINSWETNHPLKFRVVVTATAN
jgi:hypothetical protein